MEEECYFSYAYPTCCALEDSAHSSAISTLSLEVTRNWKYRQVKKKIHDLTDTLSDLWNMPAILVTSYSTQLLNSSTFCYANNVTLLALWHHLTPPFTLFIRATPTSQVHNSYSVLFPLSCAVGDCITFRSAIFVARWLLTECHTYWQCTGNLSLTLASCLHNYKSQWTQQCIKWVHFFSLTSRPTLLVSWGRGTFYYIDNRPCNDWNSTMNDCLGTVYTNTTSHLVGV